MGSPVIARSRKVYPVYTMTIPARSYRVNPGIQNNDLMTERLFAIPPSVARLWRRDRFCVYGGGGLGLERQSQYSRCHAAFPQENLDGNSVLVCSEEFPDSRYTVSTFPLILRVGVLMSLAPRIVLRGGCSHILVYFDTFASRTLEVGIGHRAQQLFAFELRCLSTGLASRFVDNRPWSQGTVF